MVELCCSKATYLEYMGGANKGEEAKGTLSYEDVRKGKLNTYTTTLHAINSAIVKLGKLTKATKVYRGIAGVRLPCLFVESPQDFRCSRPPHRPRRAARSPASPALRRPRPQPLRCTLVHLP